MIGRAIRRLVAAALIGLLVAPPAVAATYYGSDCATGGAGTIGDPYCLDPDSDGTMESVSILFDDASTEAVGGDTIILCCGGTDGCTDGAVACTYDLDCTGEITGESNEGNYWIVVDTDFDANPVTIKGNVSDGDDVTLTGDSPVDGTRGVWDGTRSTCAGHNDDISYAFASSTTIDGIGEFGNGGLIVEDLTFNRWGDGLLLREGAHSAANKANFVFRRVEVSEIVSAVWGDTDGIGDEKEAGSCDGNGDTAADATAGGAWGFYLFGGCGDLTFEDSLMHTVCGMGFRNIVNDECDHTISIAGSEFYNIYQVSNDWGNYDWMTSTGQSITYDGNYFHDNTQTLGIENYMRNVTIQDNIFACLGEFDHLNDREISDGWHTCNAMVDIGNTDDSERDGSIADVIVRRNKFFGVRKTGDTTTLEGWQWGALKIRDGCRNVAQCGSGTNNPWEGCTGVGTGTINSGGNKMNWGCATSGSYTFLVENNMFWRIDQDEFGGRDYGRASISIDSNMPVTLQNNTLVGVSYGIELDDGPATSGVTHILKNNYIVDAYDGEEVWLVNSTVNATLTNNNLRGNTAGTGNVYGQSGVGSVTCDNLDTDVGTGNICSEAKLIQCDTADWCATTNSDETTWDLHLDAADTVNKNQGTTGASEDFDQTSRPQGGASDIGADELVEAAGTSQAIIIAFLTGWGE